MCREKEITYQKHLRKKKLRFLTILEGTCMKKTIEKTTILEAAPGNALAAPGETMTKTKVYGAGGREWS